MGTTCMVTIHGMTSNYTEKHVRSLDWKQHIRQRPGMYIGKLGDGSAHDDGIYILLKEVIDNCIDEFVMGYGKTIEITMDDSTISVRDFGRGIPLGKVVECASKMNTGAKYDSVEILYPIVHLKGDDIEIAFTHGNQYGEEYYSFTNGQHTTQGGTHLSAFREAFVKTIREFYKKEYEAVDIRASVLAAISIKVMEPVFESQTKTKLGSQAIGP